MVSFVKKSGFTLIETIVSMAILAMVLGIVLSFQGSRRDQFNLTIYQEKVRALITKAKGMALNNTDTSAKSYGVQIEPSKAFIYIDRNGDYIYESGTDRALNTSLDLVIAQEGISFKNVSTSPPSDQIIDIAFEPPDPTVHLYKDGSSNISSVEVGIAVGNNYRKVVVNSVGQISVVNK